MLLNCREKSISLKQFGEAQYAQPFPIPRLLAQSLYPLNHRTKYTRMEYSHTANDKIPLIVRDLNQICSAARERLRGCSLSSFFLLLYRVRLHTYKGPECVYSLRLSRPNSLHTRGESVLFESFYNVYSVSQRDFLSQSILLRAKARIEGAARSVFHAYKSRSQRSIWDGWLSHTD